MKVLWQSGGEKWAECGTVSDWLVDDVQKKRTDLRVGQSGPATSSSCLDGRKKKKERKKAGDWWPAPRHPSPSRQNRVSRMLLRHIGCLSIKLTAFESNSTFLATNLFQFTYFFAYSRSNLCGIIFANCDRRQGNCYSFSLKCNRMDIYSFLQVRSLRIFGRLSQVFSQTGDVVIFV